MFSVITITHNREGFLSKAIQSVLNQSFKEFTYYIVDDGSTDGSASMVKHISDKRIRYFYTEQTGRLSLLRNIGLNQSNDRIITFLDSDDYWEPGYLEKLKEIYSNKEVMSVISNANILQNGNHKVLFDRDFLISVKNNFLQKRLNLDAFVIYPSCFSYIKDQTPSRFNEKLKHGDSDLFLRIISNGGTFLLEDPLVNIQKHDLNMSLNANENPSFIVSSSEEFETLYDLRKMGLISFFQYRKTKSRYRYKLAHDYLSIGRISEARAYFFKAFLCYPFNYKALIKTFLVLIK